MASVIFNNHHIEFLATEEHQIAGMQQLFASVLNLLVSYAYLGMQSCLGETIRSNFASDNQSNQC